MMRAALLLAASRLMAQTLPGTAPLEWTGDLADRMVSGIDAYLLGELQRSPARRDALAPKGDVEARRARFRRMIGVMDERLAAGPMQLVASTSSPAKVAVGDGYDVFAVRWRVLRGVDAEGLWLRRRTPPRARAIALPDAVHTPEQIAGLEDGAPSFARRLAELGCDVLVPTLIDRSPVGRYGPEAPRVIDQPRREFVYRAAFEVGRHVAGYEVQKTLAAVDWFATQQPAAPTLVFGHGEGGLIALYAAAVDSRIAAAGVSGYFDSRESIYREPVYRNVWGLLTEFGDAELAGLVAPRPLVIESATQPAEIARARRHHPGIRWIESAQPGSDAALSDLIPGDAPLPPQALPRIEPGARFDTAARAQRQFRQLVEHTQELLRDSSRARAAFHAAMPDPAARKRYLWDEIIGRLDIPAAREPVLARVQFEEAKWRGYEVAMPMLPGVFGYGVLLVPRDVKPGERRPVVVAQHGRAGRPQDLIAPPTDRARQVYKAFAAQLADRGFVVYAPQNPYIFEERYRDLQRKANPLKLSLFSFITAQHDRALQWLASLPFVDASRIGFYGLSYGGKTAVRVPPLLDGYALSICSGDFNEYGGKMAATDRADSFLYTIEHEMYEFDLANRFGYAELVHLIAPRPFMVERGHRDQVGFDEWVAYEFSKVRRHYLTLGVPERAEIEFFNGVHEIRAEGTFRFLHRWLAWPER